MLNWLSHLFGQHSPRQRERAGYEARIKGLNENILSLSDRMHGIEAERDSLRAQNQRTLGDNTALIDGMHEQEVQIHELRAQLADGHAAPRKRASRTKPTTQE